MLESSGHWCNVPNQLSFHILKCNFSIVILSYTVLFLSPNSLNIFLSCNFSTFKHAFLLHIKFFPSTPLQNIFPPKKYPSERVCFNFKVYHLSKLWIFPMFSSFKIYNFENFCSLFSSCSILLFLFFFSFS